MVAFGAGRWLPYRTTEVAAAKKLVTALAEQSDIVIVSVHGGAEGTSAERMPNCQETFYGETRVIGGVLVIESSMRASILFWVIAPACFGHGSVPRKAYRVESGQLKPVPNPGQEPSQ